MLQENLEKEQVSTTVYGGMYIVYREEQIMAHHHTIISRTQRGFFFSLKGNMIHLQTIMGVLKRNKLIGT